MLKNTFRTAVKKYLVLFLIIYIPPIILLLALGGIAGLTDIHLADFFIDPSQAIGYDAYIGLVNNIGIVLWALVIGVCIFASLILQRTGENGDIRKFLLYSGLFTIILLLDDLFLLHEHGTFSEFLVPIIIIAIFIFLLIRFRYVILQTECVFLAIAIAFFGISVIFDFIQALDTKVFPGGIHTLIEDGAKFLGIISWLVYYTRAGLTALRSTDTT